MSRPKLTDEEMKDVKKRIIEAAGKVLKEKGYENTTVRDISLLSKVNIAIIYKYFDSINELLAYCTINVLKEFQDEFSQEIKDESDLDKDVKNWGEFARITFTYPKAFYRLIFGKLSHRIEIIIKNYYELFPENVAEFNEKIKLLLKDANLFETDKVFTQKFIKDPEKAKLATVSTVSFYGLMLSRFYIAKEPMDINENVKKFMDYRRLLITSLQ